VRIDGERDPAAVGVAGAGRDGRKVDPGRERLGDAVVAEIVEPNLNTLTAGVATPPLGQAVR
jgi:hypothetical protein